MKHPPSESEPLPEELQILQKWLEAAKHPEDTPTRRNAIDNLRYVVRASGEQAPVPALLLLAQIIFEAGVRTARADRN